MSYLCTHLKEVCRGDDPSYHVYLLEDPDIKKPRLTPEDFDSIGRSLGSTTKQVADEDHPFCTYVIDAYVSRLRQPGRKYRDLPIVLVTAIPPDKLFDAKEGKGTLLGPQYALYPLGPLERAEREHDIKCLCDALGGESVDLGSLGKVLPQLDGIDVLTAEFPIELTDFEQRTKGGGDDLGDILFERWENIDKCLKAEAYVASLVMIGSLLEGALCAFARNHPEEANSANASPPDDKNGKPLPFHKWDLAHLIDVAYECNWIGDYVKDFGHHVRNYRNMVHPARQLELGITPDGNMCKLCSEVVLSALNNLV